MASPRKLGVLVAIPIKGRRLLNRTGGKQSPYIQIKLDDQKKRTKACLISTVEPEWDQEIRLDVFQGSFNMQISIFDEGKKNELIGEGILLLHEVVDKGELDVWFPVKYKGSVAGEIYFELTFYAAAPPPPPKVAASAPGGLISPQAQMQHPQMRYTSRPTGYSPPNGLHLGGPPVPFHRHPVQNAIPHIPPQQPYPIRQQNQNFYPPSRVPIIPPQQHQQQYPFSAPQIPQLPQIQTQPKPILGSVQFQPKTQYKPSPPPVMPGRYPSNNNNSNAARQPNNFANNNTNNNMYPISQPQQIRGMGRQGPPMPLPMPQPNGPANAMNYGRNNINVTPNRYPQTSPHDRTTQGMGMPTVTPPVQYNYNIGNFP